MLDSYICKLFNIKLRKRKYKEIMKKKVGIIGQRGMVGSVLIKRMKEEDDFESFIPFFFSTSQVGQKSPEFSENKELLDAYLLDDLKEMDIILTCQGSEYTKKVHPKLREISWNGFWIDAASCLRMKEGSEIVLDPVNKKNIIQSIDQRKKDFIGGNCTVSLMLMAIGSLFENDLVEWLTSSTYQAASGGGARHIKELLLQVTQASDILKGKEGINSRSALESELLLRQLQNSNILPTDCFGVPILCNLIPWIDVAMPSEQTKEEWKAQCETNKILGKGSNIPIDGTCVRISSIRCHSQAFTVKLKKNIKIEEVKTLISEYNSWTSIVENDVKSSRNYLTPAAVSGNLNIPVGRIRKMTLGEKYLNIFTCGDQLLWGAAEPLRRMLKMVLDF